MKIVRIIASAALLLAFSIQAVAQGMLTEQNSKVIKDVELETELVVAGGGLAGVCTAVS